MFRVSLFIILLIQVVCLRAQTDTLSVTQMQEDIAFYIRTLEYNHPRLYYPYSKAQIDSVFTDLKKQCTQPMPLDDFNFLLSETNRYKDVHTNISWAELQKLTLANDPFPSLITNGSTLMLKDSKVITINNIVASELASCLEGMVSWEYNPEVRQMKMASYLIPLLKLKYKEVPPYQILLEKDGEQKQWILEEKDISPRTRPEYFDKPTFYFTIDENTSIAIFHCTDFELSPKREADLKWKCEIGFKQIKDKKIKYLFIDLSNNKGGSDIMHDHIWSYILNKDYKSKIKIFATSPNLQEFQSLLKKYQPDTKAIKKSNRIKDEYNFKEYLEVDLEVKKSNTKNKFNGQIFVVQGNNTFSSAISFCYSFKLFDRGMLVGKTCGQGVPFTGNVKTVILPNSKIKFNYPMTFSEEPFIPNVKDGFLQPDIWYDLDDNKIITISDCKKIIEKAKN